MYVMYSGYREFGTFGIPCVFWRPLKVSGRDILPCWSPVTGSGVGMIPEVRLGLSTWTTFDAEVGLQERLAAAGPDVACLLRFYLIQDQEIVDESSLVWDVPQFDSIAPGCGRIEVVFRFRASLGCQDRDYCDTLRLPLFFEIESGALRLFGPEIPEPASTFEEF